MAYPKGDIRLALCRNCGLISNLAFRPELLEYSANYDETQAFSPTFLAFQRDLAARLIQRFSLSNTDVLEVGCGKGEFLVLLSSLGRNRGIGFDPSYVEGHVEIPPGCDVSFISDFYSTRYAGHTASFVCCNMTLEHIARPAAFIRTVAQAMRPDSIAFFLLPDVGRILEEAAFWDIYYEHCNYFTETSLDRLFRSCGFEVISIEKEYSGQYLAIAAALGTEPPPVRCSTDDALTRLEAETASFCVRCAGKVASWRKILLGACNSRIVVWGGGSKAVAFLAGLGVRDEIQYVVDINPRRQNTWLAGCGQQIVPPEFLRGYRPELVIVMNPVYRAEIREMLRRLDLFPRLLACE